MKISTIESIKRTGREHAEQRRNPLLREAFETLKFYRAYIDAYNDKLNRMNRSAPGMPKEVGHCFGWNNPNGFFGSGIS